MKSSAPRSKDESGGARKKSASSSSAPASVRVLPAFRLLLLLAVQGSAAAAADAVDAELSPHTTGARAVAKPRGAARMPVGVVYEADRWRRR